MVLRELKKVNFFLKISDMNLEISSFENTKCVSFTSFCVKVTNKLKVHSVIFTHKRINEYE